MSLKRKIFLEKMFLQWLEDLAPKIDTAWYIGTKHEMYIRLINSLWPCDSIWWQGSWSTLSQVMACCLKAPSHYLNQCWLIVHEVPRHSYESNFTMSVQAIILYNGFEKKNTFKITSESHRGQWVNTVKHTEINFEKILIKVQIILQRFICIKCCMPRVVLMASWNSGKSPCALC